jgi:hypothetical protein
LIERNIGISYFFETNRCPRLLHKISRHVEEPDVNIQLPTNVHKMSRAAARIPSYQAIQGLEDHIEQICPPILEHEESI